MAIVPPIVWELLVDCPDCLPLPCCFRESGPVWATPGEKLRWSFQNNTPKFNILMARCTNEINSNSLLIIDNLLCTFIYWSINITSEVFFSFCGIRYLFDLQGRENNNEVRTPNSLNYLLKIIINKKNPQYHLNTILVSKWPELWVNIYIVHKHINLRKYLT